MPDEEKVQSEVWTAKERDMRKILLYDSRLQEAFSDSFDLMWSSHPVSSGRDSCCDGALHQRKMIHDDPLLGLHRAGPARPSHATGKSRGMDHWLGAGSYRGFGRIPDFACDGL